MTRLLTQIPGKFRSRRSIRRFLILSSWLLILHELYSLLTHQETNLTISASKVLRSSAFNKKPDYILPPHPVRIRLEAARQKWKEKVRSQSVTYPQFKAKYRARYKIEPPQGMREWFEVVSTDGILLVDEFDEMMNSLKIFRSMGPEELERRTLEVSSMPTFSLLNITGRHAYFSGQNYRGDGKRYSRDNYGPGLERVEGLASMMQRHIRRIPDGLLFAVSELAEPRVIVPWQDHPNTLKAFEKGTSKKNKRRKNRENEEEGEEEEEEEEDDDDEILRDYHLRLTTPSLEKLLPTPSFRGSGSAWELYAKSCPPESSARKKLLSLKGSSAMKQSHQQIQSNKNKKKFHNGKDKLKPMIDNPVQAKMGKYKIGLSKRRTPSSITTKDQISGGGNSNSTITGQSLENGDLTSFSNNDKSDASDPNNFNFDPTCGSPKGFNDLESLIESSDEFKFVRLNYRGLTHPELCQDSELHQIQGAFFSDWRGLSALYPVFSPSKIDGFSDILIPSNFYYGDDARYSFKSNETIDWKDKHDKLFWRGATTGGGNSPPRHQMQYQRHRFVRIAESLSTNLKSLLVPKSKTGFIYHVKRSLVDLNRAWMDVGFTGFTGCGEPDICRLTEKIFKLKKPVPLDEMAKYKAILDLDGMAFSGRFVALMSMGSGVLKSTIFKDAFTDWVEPWVHYIPLSVGYAELYNLLAYFLPLPNSEEFEENEKFKKMSTLKRLIFYGFGKNSGIREGDEDLRKVAEHGLEWSNNIGNKPDIEAYVYRLALEWGRLMGKLGDEDKDEDEENEIREINEENLKEEEKKKNNKKKKNTKVEKELNKRKLKVEEVKDLNKGEEDDLEGGRKQREDKDEEGGEVDINDEEEH